MENPYEPTRRICESHPADALLAEARRVTFWPGVAMVIQGSVISLAFVFAISADIYEHGVSNFNSDQTIVFVSVAVISAFLLTWCGVAMIRLTSYRLSYVGAALSLFLFLPVGLFIGIWACFVLSRLKVREAFRKVSNKRVFPAI